MFYSFLDDIDSLGIRKFPENSSWSKEESPEVGRRHRGGQAGREPNILMVA